VESRNDGRLMHTMDKKFLIHTIVNISTIHWMSSSQKVNISTR
jgi:hypothetical protein